MSIRSRFSIADNAFPTSQFIELGAIRLAPSLCDTRSAVGGSFRQTAKMAEVSIVMSIPNNTIVQLLRQEMNYWRSPVFLTRLCKNPFGARRSAVDNGFCVVSFHSFSVADLSKLFKQKST
jgi:hypothetical protein